MLPQLRTHLVGAVCPHQSQTQLLPQLHFLNPARPSPATMATRTLSEFTRSNEAKRQSHFCNHQHDSKKMKSGGGKGKERRGDKKRPSVMIGLAELNDMGTLKAKRGRESLNLPPLIWWRHITTVSVHLFHNVTYTTNSVSWSICPELWFPSTWSNTNWTGDRDLLL